MVRPVGYPVVLLCLLQVLLHTPAILVELSYAIIGVGKLAGPVQLESTLQVLGVSQRPLAQDISKVALGEIVSQGDGAFIPVYGLVDVLLHTDTILEEGADVVDEIRVIESLMLIVIGYDPKHIKDLLLGETMIFRIACVGQVAETALDTHDDYVYHITKYMTQKSDEAIAEMETRFQVQEKDRKLERRGYQIVLLLMLVLLAAAIIVIAVNSLNRARRRNAELRRINDTKEQLIALLSKDLRNPANAQSSELDKLSSEAATLSPDEIRERCRQIAQGAKSLNEDVARYVGDLLVDRSKRIADIGLTQREIQVIRLSAEGLSAAQIAERTFLSVHTVNTHRQHIYAKMGVGNVSEMLHKAGELGIL